MSHTVSHYLSSHHGEVPVAFQYPNTRTLILKWSVKQETKSMKYHTIQTGHTADGILQQHLVHGCHISKL